jgi:8-oxo-dGTP pyrophosphatase MutT (NUDIX family)
MNLTIHFSSGKVILTDDPTIPKQNNSIETTDYSLSKELILFDLTKNQHEKIIYLSQPESFANLLDSSVTWIEAAGGYVLNNKDEALMIFRRGKWDLPKGKIDQGENSKEAALREVIEECGIKKLSILQKLIDTYHCYQQNGGFILKKTHWYIMTSNFEGKLSPQAEEGISKAEWRKINSLSELYSNTYPSIQEVLDAGKRFKL